MPATISKSELESVKAAITDAERGQATLLQLAQAHSIAERTGGGATIGILRAHIRRLTPSPTATKMIRTFLVGLASGTMVWLLLGRHGEVKFS